ncbi:hypothetical protein HanPSC8_Chr12g0504661 [Helianthus annuus]|nr:hypothetical protein HanPSC8_Chr12g0504661 [Helianthus annuus]
MYLVFQRESNETINEDVLASVIRIATRSGSVITGSQLHRLVIKTLNQNTDPSLLTFVTLRGVSDSLLAL